MPVNRRTRRFDTACMDARGEVQVGDPVRSTPAAPPAAEAGDRRAVGSRLRLLLFDSLVLVPASAIAFGVLQHAGLIADDAPFPALVALLLLAHVLGAATTVWTDRRPALRPAFHVRLAVQFLAATAVLYATGWGPALSLAYLLVVQDVLRSSGADRWRWCVAWTAASIGIGQAAIALGAAPTLVDEPAVHGLAVLGILTLVFVCRVLADALRQHEEARTAVRQREGRFRALVRHSFDVVSVVGAHGDLRFVSPAVERVLGYAEDEVLGRGALSFVDPVDLERSARLFGDLLERPHGTLQAEVRVQHRDGGVRWLECHAVNLLDDPDVEGVVVNWRDVTERQRLAEQLRFDASHDPLTGLANRSAFSEALERAVARAERSAHHVAVLFVDLDGLKTANDSFGHEAGDALLVEVGVALVEAVRPGDLVARLGGDEFTVLLDPVGSEDDAVAVAERIVSLFPVGERPSVASTSIGIAVSDGSSSASSLLRAADVAMYTAKQGGGDRWQLFGEGQIHLPGGSAA